ncbi:LysR family transcriptional regulator [Lederbergia citri]|uniref:LysR family transcriptional regulator n=1 Tax=Lederbergia citri TaxID=2833580 RepID=A0A942YJT8_9BACI|nr:LysR family transcriptional regulator [Lederbergia citri]MBS4197900.1 LysR family transcriptional regulator [Lederbergia citri]
MYNHQLDTFIRIADAGSFGKAAESLYVSAPAIIQQINLLEERCGFKLFRRSNHGVKLTPAGKSLYKDAQAIIKLSENALDKARHLAKSAESTIRIGTSLLFKCRLLPDICSKISELHPELKFEIPSLSEQLTRDNDFSDIGVKFDILEGINCTISWKGLCNFLELMRTPICCAVAKEHPLAHRDILKMDDLNGECLVMPIQNVSKELDGFRREIKRNFPATRIIDSPYFGLDTFTFCEMNPYILITQPVYSDIHTNLVTIPLNTEYTLPYGLIYANEPTMATSKFIDLVKRVKEAE